MRRLSAIAAIAALALLSISAQAQRMGGRGMGGGGAGVRGPAVGVRGPAMGVRGPGMGVRGPVAAPGRVGPVVARGRGVAVRTVSPSGGVFINGGFHSPFFPGHCFGAFPCRNRFFFHNHFFNPFFFGAGFGWGVPWWPSSYVPGFDSGYYAPPQQPVVVPSDTGNANDMQLALQMQRLTDEVESMREEQRRQAAQAPGASLSARQPVVSTTFVFRDGHRISTQNYAIAGQTLWVLSEHTARKVAIADLDLAATEQANAANGIELHIPEPPAR